MQAADEGEIGRVYLHLHCTVYQMERSQTTYVIQYGLSASLGIKTTSHASNGNWNQNKGHEKTLFSLTKRRIFFS